MSQEVFEAIRSGDGGELRRLLEIDPAAALARDEQGVSALLQSLYHRRPDLARAVRSHLSDIDPWEAAALGELDRLGVLLDADPESVGRLSPDGFTPLHLAAFFRQGASVKLLLARGADPDAVARNPTLVRPLNSAVAGGDEACVEALLAAGADPDSRQQGGFTPLMGAATAGLTFLVKLLLETGADPSLQSEDGDTARDLAEANGRVETAEVLGGPHPSG